MKTMISLYLLERTINFAILKRVYERMENKRGAGMIYFDNSATTKAEASVLRTYQTVSEQFLETPRAYIN